MNAPVHPRRSLAPARLDRQAARRAHLGRRYGDPQLGDALAAIVAALGRPHSRLNGGREPLTVVRAWDVALANWLASIPQNPDAWQPLIAEVRAVRRSATTQAWRKAALALKDAKEHAEFTGQPFTYAGPPADAKAYLRLAMSTEVYAYLAKRKWQARAWLMAAGELPPLPENLPDDDEADGGGPAAPEEGGFAP